MEFINCNKWRTLCNHIYDAPEFILPKDKDIVYVPMDHIAQFIRDVSNLPYSFIVVSACSDYGLHYQHEHPVWADMKKWLDFVAIDENLGYNPLFLPPRCDVTHTKITDTYSVKMHAFTKATFSNIPNQFFKWYCTNANIASKVIPIPFGIPDWSESLITEARNNNRHVESEKDIGFYINFQNNTAERVSVKDKYKKYQHDNAPISVKVIEKEISHEEYIENVLKSVYVVSPSGNGLDCYRNLEALYCGAIPIIADTHAAKAYEGLPVIKIKNFGMLEQLASELGYKVIRTDLTDTPADMNYWRKKIQEDAENLKSLY